MKGFTAIRAQKQREEDYDAVASQQVWSHDKCVEGVAGDEEWQVLSTRVYL